MTEATATKSKSAKTAAHAFDSAKYSTPSFSMPKFDMPKFEVPKIEVPAAFRDIAESAASQAKSNYEKMKAAAEETTDVLEDTFATASRGATDYGTKMIEAARSNTNAAFDYATALLGAKTLAETIELSTTHLRKQFEAFQQQSKELTELAQKVATDSVEPIRESVTKAFSKAS